MAVQKAMRSGDRTSSSRAAQCCFGTSADDCFPAQRKLPASSNNFSPGHRGQRDILAARAFSVFLSSDAWEDKVSDKPSPDTDTGGSGFQAAKMLLRRRRSKYRASAPGAYDAGAKAARYVGEATADHPVSALLVTLPWPFLPATPAILDEKTIDGAGEIRPVIGRSVVTN